MFRPCPVFERMASTTLRRLRGCSGNCGSRRVLDHCSGRILRCKKKQNDLGNQLPPIFSVPCALSLPHPNSYSSRYYCIKESLVLAT